MKKMILYLVPAFVFILVPTSAHAYIDPGTGSLIIQSIAAASVGLIFYLKVYWHKFRNIFTKKDSAKETEVTETKDDQ